MRQPVQIISAPSILGLKPTGVEHLSSELLSLGLAKRTGTTIVNPIPPLNHLYKNFRDKTTLCLNTEAIRKFSFLLEKKIVQSLDKSYLSLVLGGDCSILIGAMLALKSRGDYGLLFLDAHADFYQPEQSITGEVADMDLSIVTGHEPARLSNIRRLSPYVKEQNVIHIGQRDWKETKQYQSQDIRKTKITVISNAQLQQKGIRSTANAIMQKMKKMNVQGFWIHFDADVLNDKINPAVDYRLPGGLSYVQINYLLSRLFATGSIVGITFTILNPSLDNKRTVLKKIVALFEGLLNHRL
jgi:arginase